MHLRAFCEGLLSSDTVSGLRQNLSLQDCLKRERNGFCFLLAREDGRMRRLPSGHEESELDAAVRRVPTFWAVTPRVVWCRFAVFCSLK